MQRRDFLKSGAALALAAELAGGRAHGVEAAHNWSGYDFGSGPVVRDRLNQGPFPQYPPDAVIPSDEVVMTTSPSDAVVPNYGKGLITYITADSGTTEIKADDVLRGIEELVQFPLGQQLYIRPTWREVQPRPGKLVLPDYIKLIFELAKKNNKRVGLRIQMSAPDYKSEPALPAFVLDKVPTVDLIPDPSEKQAAARFIANPYSKYQPRFDHPFFQQSFAELVRLLVDEFNGNPQVEFVDTFMYGFWGEGHTWPFTNTPFPDALTAERTWMKMLDVQLEHFTKTPLLTNTQPDYSRVGNAAMLDRTVRSNNWIRSDTIFIENEQIEALSNRPPWIAALLEQGIPAKPPEKATGDDNDLSPTENMIAHVMDVGANYWSLWNFHAISAQNLQAYYEAYPKAFDQINRRIGYRVRPSMIWSYEDSGYMGLIVAFANDGIAGVPGVLRVSVENADGMVLARGCLDAGYPLPGKLRQAQFVLPPGTKFAGLKLKAEIEVKGMRYPVQWACRQRLNEDGSLTLRANLRQGL